MDKYNVSPAQQDLKAFLELAESIGISSRAIEKIIEIFSVTKSIQIFPTFM